MILGCVEVELVLFFVLEVVLVGPLLLPGLGDLAVEWLLAHEQLPFLHNLTHVVLTNQINNQYKPGTNQYSESVSLSVPLSGCSSRYYYNMSAFTIAKILSHSQELPLTVHSQQEEVEAWLKDRISATKKVFKESQHIRSIQLGFQIEFVNNKFNTFFAYFRTEKIKCCEYPLLYGVNKGWTLKGAVMYLGEPPRKSHRAIEIIYPHLGLGLVFGGTWSNENSLISEAYFYERQKMRVCAGCGKEFEESEGEECRLFNKEGKLLECRCQCVMYCSLGCVGKHYRQHLIFCELGEL